MARVAVILLAATLVGVPLASQDALHSFIDENRSALVYIESRYVAANGAEAVENGTGFVISNGRYVITCAHVLADTGKPDGGRAEHKGYVGATEGPSYSLEVIDRNPKLDVALLKFRSDGIKVKPLRAVRSEPARGDGVAAVGFIDHLLLPAKGEISSVGGPGGNWITSASFNHGYSGGPVIRRDGRVVGIARAGRADAERHRYIIPLSHADALFRMAAVSIDEETAPAIAAGIPPRTDYGDLPPEGSCEERQPVFERPGEGLRWRCNKTEVQASGEQRKWIHDHVDVEIPKNAEIRDVRYFHRSRVDFRNPQPVGPWHRNAPEGDLMWMTMGKATVIEQPDKRIVRTPCSNQSHIFPMHCAVGVQYREAVRLW